MRRTPQIQTGTGLLALILTAGLLAVTSLTAIQARDLPAAESTTPTLLSAGQAAALAGGFGPFFADLNWIRVVGIPDAEFDTDAGAMHIFQLLDRVTSFDPGFTPAYHFGGILLSVRAGRTDLSDRLLERARQRYPDDWSYPFYLGFNRFYYNLDFTGAAAYFEQASRLPGAPPYFAGLAARLRNQETDRETARELLQRMIHVTDDPVVKQRLQKRIEQLEIPA